MNIGIIPSKWSGALLSVLRIFTGLLFISHGMTKLFNFPATLSFPTPMPVFSFMGVAGLIELVGGALIILGLFTRLTAFILAGQMAIAYFLVHASQSFYPINNGGELAIMFCFVFLYLAANGPGPWSLDARRA